MIQRALFVVCFSLAACAQGSGVSKDKPDLSVAGDNADLASNSDGPVNPDPTTDPLATSFMEIRAVMHVHSVYSHDACDGNGLPGGQRNMTCWNELRAAVCSVGLNFVGLTDHPAHMREYSMDGEFLFDPAKGDQPIVEAGVTVGNHLKCDDGHTVLITEGYEAAHTLPVAFTSQPTTDSAYGDLIDARPIADVKAMITELKSHGALVASVHSEEDDVSASTLIASGAEAMEWYNPHGNFKTFLGADNGIGLGALDALNLVGDMTPFMTGSDAGAHSDLVYLLLLPKWPQKGFDKWRAVQRDHTITGILGSDVHQNVSVTPLCTGNLVIPCQLAAAGSSGKQQALALLASGGLIVMKDGRRLDAYERIFRWLENRVLVTESSPGAVRDALRAGRNYGLFSVFGAPEGFRYAGQAGGTLLEMGAAQKGPINLTVRLPKSAVQLTGAAWSATDGKKIEVRASLYRTSGTETTLVKESKVLGDTMTFTATDPGAYHVEIWNKPKHLTTALGNQAALADIEYLWIISNPIRVLP